MSVARIICDASYNEDIHLGGFSGGLMVEQPNGNDWTSVYHGLSPDAFCSNEAEMHAIAMGAQKLASMMNSTRQSIDKVEIYTDSKTAISQYKLYTNGKKHDPKYDKAMRRMDRYLGALKTNKGITFTHVPAHRPDHKATPIERLHNIVDKNALSTRWMAQNHIFEPDVSNSKYYGITLNANPKGDKADALRQIGYHYAKQGMVARVALLGKSPDLNNHPFTEGVRQAAEETGQNPDSLMRLYRWSRNGGVTQGCEGMDRALIRHHYRSLGKFSHHVNFELMPFLNAGVAVRLMYGEQYPKDMNDKMLTGRVEPASKFMLNTFEMPTNKRPSYTNEWVDTLTPYTKIPLVVGMENILAHAAIPEENKITTPNQEVKEALRDALPEGIKSLPPKAVCSVVAQVMLQHGKPLSESSLEHLERGIENDGLSGELLIYEAIQESNKNNDNTNPEQAEPHPEQRRDQALDLESKSRPTLRI